MIMKDNTKNRLLKYSH